MGLVPFSNFHDLHHLITFLVHPQFMSQVRRHMREFDSVESLNVEERRRLSYSLESLSLANPKSVSSLAENLLIPKFKGYSKVIDQGVYRDYFKTLPVDVLLIHAAKMTKYFGKYLNYYAGAAASHTERALEKINLFKNVNADEVMRGLMEAEDFNHNLDLPRNSFSEDPVHWGSKLEIILKHRKDHIKKGISAKELKRVDESIRVLLSRMEYFLWHGANNIHISTWLNDIVKPGFKREGNESLEFLRFAFGETSITYRMIKGRL